MKLHNAADTAIWLAYVAIPLVLVYFIRKRRDVPFPRIFWMFGLFIVSCGLTHLMNLVTNFVPVYRADAAMKLVTAAASWGTVLVLIPLTPKALALKSPRELEHINAKLEEEVAVRRRAELELRRQRDFSDKILKSSYDGILAFDRDCRYTLWNAGMERISGVPATDVLDRSAFDVFPFLKQNGGDRYFHEALAGRSAISPETPFDIPSSGKKGFFEGHYSPLLGDDGSVIGGVAIIRDVTARKEAQEALARRADELDRANRALKENERLKDEFVANVSHELRTPLTLVLAPLEGLLSTADGAPRAELDVELARTMHRNAIRLLRMVNSLLDFSKLQARQYESRPEAVDVAVLARSVVADFRDLAAQRGLRLACEVGPAPSAVRVDRYAFERIAFNLLSNAIKFSEKGDILFRLGWKEGRLLLTVRDAGRGISAADLPRLFQRFRQLEGSSTRRVEGSGLGLALVKELVDTLGGSVDVESEPGRGSTFSVALPAPETRETPSGESPLLWRPAVEPTLELPLPSSEDEPDDLPKVLIVEDNLDLAAHMRELLRGRCRARLEANGDRGLAAAREWKPDLVISDVMMPERDGFALCRELKSDPRTSTIPVMLLTALTHREALLKGWEAGADEYLFKPFHPRELQTRVRSLLDASLRRRLLAARTRQLEEAVGNLEAFSYTVAHDLKAPVRGLLTYSQLLMEEHAKALPKDGQDYVRRISKAAGHMDTLIRDLLAYSGLTRDNFELGPVDTGALARGLVEKMSGELAGAEVEIADGLPPLLGHSMTLGLALGNLLSNAVKFVAPGVKPRVAVGAERRGEKVRLWVRDNGIGIPEKYRDKLFRLFERLHDDKTYPGTGIGLAIVKKAVERMGGAAGFESEPGKGSRFWIELPAA